MRLRVVSPFCLGSGRDVFEGEELQAPGDLTLASANVKIATGLLVEVQDPLAVASTRPTVLTADPASVHADPDVRTPAEEKPQTRIAKKKTKVQRRGPTDR